MVRRVRSTHVRSSMCRDGRTQAYLVGSAVENLIQSEREGKNMVHYDGN